MENQRKALQTDRAGTHGKARKHAGSDSHRPGCKLMSAAPRRTCPQGTWCRPRGLGVHTKTIETTQRLGCQPNSQVVSAPVVAVMVPTGQSRQKR